MTLPETLTVASQQARERALWRAEIVDTAKLALPIALTQLGQIAMMTTDLVLIGQLGPHAVAAVGLAHLILFCGFVLGMASLALQLILIYAAVEAPFTGGALGISGVPKFAILGIRFEETGRMQREEWSHVFTPTDATGKPIDPKNLPLVVALDQGRPASAEMYIEGLDEARRHIHVIGMPLIGLAGKRLGGLAIFWEVP